MCGGGPCYIGLYRDHWNNSKWNWTDETEVDYTPWAPGQPTFNREPGESNASSTMVAFTAPNGEGWDDGNVYGADEDDSPAVCLKTRAAKNLPLFVAAGGKGTWEEVRAKKR